MKRDTSQKNADSVRLPPGDGEELLAAFTERLIEARRQLGGASGVPDRRQLLLELAKVPGVYVPQVSCSRACDEFYKSIRAASGELLLAPAQPGA